MSFEEHYVEVLQNAVERVKSVEDPVKLNELKKLFKKNVPFTLRSYVAAYLAKELNFSGKRDSFRNRRDSFRSRRDRFDSSIDRPIRTEREPSTRVEIPEDLANQVFISIGRNRRVYPRDLITLIIQNTSVERARIGDIRVLDNYSFVQLYAEDCDGVISSLDGIEYRGKRLTVSYSRKRIDEEITDQTSIPQMEDEVQDTFQYDEEDRAAYALAEKAVEAASKHGSY